MRRVLADLRAYAKQFMRNPTASFFTLAFPILLILIFGGVFGAPEEISLEIHVQDLDRSPMSQALVEAMNTTGVMNVVMVDTGLEIIGYVRDQSITVALVIPEGFEGEVLLSVAPNSTAQPTVTLYGDPSSSTFQTVGGVVEGIVTAMVFELYGATPVMVETQSISQDAFSYIDFFVPGVVGITVLTPIFFTSSIAAEYRERHYFKLLATTPLRKGEYLFSRTIWMIGLIFLSTILMILVARLVFGASFFLDAISVALIAAGAILFVSLGMAIGSFAKDIEAASALANVVYFPMMFLTGTFFPVDVMPDFIQVVSRALPLTYFNDGLRDTLIFGNVSSALFNLAVVSVLAVIFFVLSAWSLRWRAE